MEDLKAKYAEKEKELETYLASSNPQSEENAKDTEEDNQKGELDNQGYETELSFDDLSRNPDNHVGRKVKFTGYIIQVIQGDVVTQYRLAIDGDQKKIIYIEIDNSKFSNGRILEEDNVTIYGVSHGLYSYQATSGAQITLPAVLIDQFEIN